MKLQKSEFGFTLIEVLVALAVLALSAASLIGASEAHVARIYGLEMRAAARWAAEQHLAELQIGAISAGGGRRELTMMDRDWRLETQLEDTDDPDIARAIIDVYAMDDDRRYAHLTGFLDQAS